MTQRTAAALAAVLALSATAAQAQGGPPPALDVVLKPHRTAGQVDFVEVTLKVQAPDAKVNAPLLRLPMIFASVETARYQAAEITVTDAKGAVPLVQKDDPADPGNFLYFRRWLAGRDTQGDLTVRYKAPARVFRPALGSGPPFDLRPEAGGLNGAGVSFLAAPDTRIPYRIHLQWDLADMPAGARGAWSLGEGEVRTVGPVDVLVNAYYMAGEMKSEPVGPPGPFGIYWLGEPPFNAGAVGEWTAKAYKAIAAFYGEPHKPYRVFFRKNPYPGVGGAGLVGSFMSGFSDDPPPTEKHMRGHLAHEMVHNWPGGLDGPNGVVSWYGEGMAEFYDPVLTWRAGLISTEDLLEDVNDRAKGYYGSAVRDLPASEIANLFWSDTRVRSLPYNRGSLYMAKVDAQIRAESDGKRKLDDIALAMVARKKAGQSYDTEAWLSLLTTELGPQARTEFEDMLAGKLLDLPSNTFGPCFQREATTYAQFELGFDPASLTASPRVVKGLVAGSAAAKAGLKDGDEITAAVVLDRAQSDPESPIVIPLRRNGATMTVTYAPTGKSADGWRWIRTSGVPDSACAI